MTLTLVQTLLRIFWKVHSWNSGRAQSNIQEKSIHEIIIVENGEARTTTLAIAEGTENQHASVMLLVRNYLSDLEEFGFVDLKSRKAEGSGRPTEFALLNEHQATLIMTYMKNTEVIRTFKIRLVKEFSEILEK